MGEDTNGDHNNHLRVRELLEALVHEHLTNSMRSTVNYRRRKSCFNSVAKLTRARGNLVRAAQTDGKLAALIHVVDGMVRRHPSQ
jgi:hypothetical protein